MANLPPSFGKPKGIVIDEEAARKKVEQARPKPIPSKAPTALTNLAEKHLEKPTDLKRKKYSSKSQTDIQKRQRTSGLSIVEKELGSAAAQYISDSEVNSWQSLPEEEDEQAMIKAAAQLLTQSLRRATTSKSIRARLYTLDLEKQQLAGKLKESDKLWKEVSKKKDDEIAELKRENAAVNSLNESLSKVRDEAYLERSNLLARIKAMEEEKKSGWAEEKQAFGDAKFEEGFNFYLVGFLAHDLNYSFAQHGEATVAWIEEFKVRHAAAIKEKRIELGLDVAETKYVEDHAREGAPLLTTAVTSAGQDAEDVPIPSAGRDDPNTQPPGSDVLHVGLDGAIHTIEVDPNNAVNPESTPKA